MHEPMSLYDPKHLVCKLSSGDIAPMNLNILFCRDANALAYAIKRSCENKAEVVSLDEKESGLRATLNLGHTFGHVSSRNFHDCLEII